MNQVVTKMLSPHRCVVDLEIQALQEYENGTSHTRPWVARRHRSRDILSVPFDPTWKVACPQTSAPPMADLFVCENWKDLVCCILDRMYTQAPSTIVMKNNYLMIGKSGLRPSKKTNVMVSRQTGPGFSPPHE